MNVHPNDSKGASNQAVQNVKNNVLHQPQGALKENFIKSFLFWNLLGWIDNSYKYDETCHETDSSRQDPDG